MQNMNQKSFIKFHINQQLAVGYFSEGCRFLCQAGNGVDMGLITSRRMLLLVWWPWAATDNLGLAPQMLPVIY
ncbi:hypothetical protein [Mangrovibacterium marinum]|uniref:hypothetical protein n=1 Tax=Mangrovibacterium marinum TaxID=1639118 RepID=UPI0011B1E6D0|nr:hypothetical protein [Mangrovibacterium marinum]